MFGLNSPRPTAQRPARKPAQIKRHYLRSFAATGKPDAPRNLLLMYDIPHARKKDRDWFRRQLKALGFIMIQKSVWVGPGPLPKDFHDYVKSIGIENEFKTFKLAKAYPSSTSGART
ncbi:MAG: CRISPR-associated endonuclease Cas2 [bacterium]